MVILLNDIVINYDIVTTMSSNSNSYLPDIYTRHSSPTRQRCARAVLTCGLCVKSVTQTHRLGSYNTRNTSRLLAIPPNAVFILSWKGNRRFCRWHLRLQHESRWANGQVKFTSGMIESYEVVLVDHIAGAGAGLDSELVSRGRLDILDVDHGEILNVFWNWGQWRVNPIASTEQLPSTPSPINPMKHGLIRKKGEVIYLRSRTPHRPFWSGRQRIESSSRAPAIRWGRRRRETNWRLARSMSKRESKAHRPWSASSPNYWVRWCQSRCSTSDTVGTWSRTEDSAPMRQKMKQINRYINESGTWHTAPATVRSLLSISE